MKFGRHADPNYSLVDFQSVKITDKAEKYGIDGLIFMILLEAVLCFKKR
ncbi:hypothetical protein HCUR_00862 [Holospora curviuscula]|uniref:Uncharacterized protein n=2 Tax=Holospora curviuscula TaxID=1082868 RepID=A0A2S5R8I0_9PROT|nr:hypothetical protein HCUR_00862 [Holospora curviuscula]